MKKILFIIFLFLPFVCFADTVYLKTGIKFEGTIAKETEDEIWLKTKVGSGTMETTFKKNEIEKIEISAEKKTKTRPPIIEKESAPQQNISESHKKEDPLNPDTIYFKDGHSIEGEIVRETDEFVILKEHVGKTHVTRQRYKRSGIERIEKSSVSPVSQKKVVIPYQAGNPYQQGDTIYFKDGRSIKGLVTGFTDDIVTAVVPIKEPVEEYGFTKMKYKRSEIERVLFENGETMREEEERLISQKAPKVVLSEAARHIQQGRRYFFREDFKKAISEFNKALEVEPDNIEAFSYLGHLYFSKEDFEKAASEFNKVLEVDPDNIEAIISVGHAYRVLKQYDDAEKYFKLACKKDPDNPRAYNSLSSFYYSKERMPEAVQYYEKGSEYHGVGNFKKAAVEYEEAIKLESDYIQAIAGLGVAYAGLDQYDKSEKYLKRVLEMEPYSFNVHGTLSYIYFKQERYNDSLEECRKAVQIKPNDATIHCRIGRNLLFMGSMNSSEKMISEAKKEFEKALELGATGGDAESAEAGLRIIKRDHY